MLKRSRMKRSRKRKPESPYSDFLRHQPCLRCGRESYGGIHHQQGAGMGMRADHEDGIPMCGTGTTGCHGDLHSLATNGMFSGYDKGRRRQWETDRIAEMRALWELRCKAMN